MNSKAKRESLLVLAKLVEVSRENGLVFGQRSEDVAFVASGPKKLVRGGDFVLERRHERRLLFEFFLNESKAYL